VKCLTVRQPHAQLIVLGPKRIETRSWATKYRGPLVIHAAKQRPTPGTYVALGEYMAEQVIRDGRYGPWHLWSGRPFQGVEDYGPLNFGAIVASCALVDCVPIGGPSDFSTGLREGEEPPTAGMDVIVHHPKSEAWRECLILDHWQGPNEEITDQLPYGDFTPGRYAWLLEDIQPVEKRCPNETCYRGLAIDDEDELGTCLVCKGKGHTDPIPAKGKQGIWEWNP
jgi:hypothetical protein